MQCIEAKVFNNVLLFKSLFKGMLRPPGRGDISVLMKASCWKICPVLLFFLIFSSKFRVRGALPLRHQSWLLIGVMRRFTLCNQDA